MFVCEPAYGIVIVENIISSIGVVVFTTSCLTSLVTSVDDSRKHDSVSSVIHSPLDYWIGACETLRKSAYFASLAKIVKYFWTIFNRFFIDSSWVSIVLKSLTGKNLVLRCSKSCIGRDLGEIYFHAVFFFICRRRSIQRQPFPAFDPIVDNCRDQHSWVAAAANLNFKDFYFFNIQGLDSKHGDEQFQSSGRWYFKT